MTRIYANAEMHFSPKKEAFHAKKPANNFAFLYEYTTPSLPFLYFKAIIIYFNVTTDNEAVGFSAVNCEIVIRN